LSLLIVDGALFPVLAIQNPCIGIHALGLSNWTHSAISERNGGVGEGVAAGADPYRLASTFVRCR